MKSSSFKYFLAIIMTSGLLGISNNGLKAQVDTISGFFLEEIDFADWVAGDGLQNSPSFIIPRVLFLDGTSLQEVDSLMQLEGEGNELYTLLHVVSWREDINRLCQAQLDSVYDTHTFGVGGLFKTPGMLWEQKNYGMFENSVNQFLSEKRCYALYYGTVVVYKFEIDNIKKIRQCHFYLGDRDGSFLVNSPINKTDFLMLLYR